MQGMKQQRYLTLDAMRGVAALLVVYRHFSDIRGHSEPFFSYLAVDLFFLLSGFVLDLSYRAKFAAGLLPRQFITLRIIRLWPMYTIGALIGAVGLLIEFKAGRLSPDNAFAGLISSLLILPSPTWSFSPILFPTNAPAWSLFFEFYIANMLFCLLKGCQKTAVVWLIVVVSLVSLLVAQQRFESLNIGANWSSVLGGVPRVMFSFFAGVLLQRFHSLRHAPFRFHSWNIISILLLVMIVPHSYVNTYAYEILCVSVIFPILVYFGAQAVERRPELGAALGDSSYGIYVLHYPLLKGCERFMKAWHIYPNYGIQCVFLCAVSILAIVLYKYFDVPARQWCVHFINRIAPDILVRRVGVKG